MFTTMGLLALHIPSLFSLLSVSTTTEVSVSWILVNTAIEKGKSVTLNCSVNGIKNIDLSVTRQWSVGNYGDLIMYNGHTNTPSKYTEILVGNSFSLKINQATSEDLNLVYECRYGFAIYKMLLTVENSNILDQPPGHATDISYEQAGSSLTINIYFHNVISVPNCSIEYLNMSPLNVNTLMQRKQEYILSVNIPCTKETELCNKDLHISCNNSQLAYYKKANKEIVKLKDCFWNITIVCICLVFCVICLLVVIVRLKWKVKKTRRRKERQDTTHATESLITRENVKTTTI